MQDQAAQVGDEKTGDGKSDEEPSFTPLTAQEAQQLRNAQPPVSTWRVVALQMAVGLVVALVALAFTRRASVGWSALYGAAAVVIPAALFARGLMSRFATLNAGTVVFSFLLWEMVKIAVTVAMLFAATQVVQDLSWPAMLVGLVVTMKAYWLAPWLRPKAKIGTVD